MHFPPNLLAPTRKVVAAAFQQAISSKPTGIALRRYITWLENRMPTNSPAGGDALVPNDPFPWATLLERSWKSIRSELDQLSHNFDALPRFDDISPEQQRISENANWRTYFLYGYGAPVARAYDRCPQTGALLDQIPGLITAFFSVLGPGSRVTPHHGPYKGALRYHLGLQIPADRERCGLRVGDHTLHWEEGQGFFFDDTYEHEVWNETDEWRVVLFLDVARPLRFPYSVMNEALIGLISRSAQVATARSNHEAWEESFERLFDASAGPRKP
ncbi:aspartyl/asparaginyl beta-hydroxylase domain-containing protein [Nocardia sp. bgisy118]|uniref:aspartyl/asparaginyl beta-hydroxylase domain-containing protein n=1 Tax=Nocardia sp. bgisy118 TaxID=3413786 RepID=UPI003F4A0027